MQFQLDLAALFQKPLKHLWAILTPYELALWRVKWQKGHFGSWATDLRHGMVCVASGGGKRARDWMLDPGDEKKVSAEVGLRMMSAQINKQHRNKPRYLMGTYQHGRSSKNKC